MLTQALGSVTAGLSSMAYIAAKSASDELKMAALCSLCSSCLLAGYTAVHYWYTTGKKEAMAHAGATTGVLALCTAALLRK